MTALEQVRRPVGPRDRHRAHQCSVTLINDSFAIAAPVRLHARWTRTTLCGPLPSSATALAVIIPTYVFDGPHDLRFRAAHDWERVDVHWILTVGSKCERKRYRLPTPRGCGHDGRRFWSRFLGYP